MSGHLALASSVDQTLVAVPAYNAGFMILSYIVSLTGCATTLELLHRRTSNHGLYNWYLLVTSSISMGGVGIWCMHYIGNRATSLDFGGTVTQISYSSKFTAISFFLPIGMLMLAFYFIGITETTSLFVLIVGGTLTGAAVCGMHYVGQLDISHYSCNYDIAHVVGAAVIAVFAANVALVVFFRLRASWTDSWWKRGLCASVLAIAVSGMHWTAATGTSYTIKESHTLTTSFSSTQTVIVCTILSVSTCFFLIAIALITKRKRSRSANRARQLVLACAFFDTSGRVMVTPEGFLPNQKITNHYLERTFAEDGFSRTHPAFIWAFRATRSWTDLKKLIPGMKIHLASNNAETKYRSDNVSVFDETTELDSEFDLLFKELFCVAAQSLADQIHEPLDKLGVLYGDVIATGTNRIPAQHKNSTVSLQKIMEFSERADPEEGEMPYIFGKGQFVFLVRQLSRQEAASFAALGHRFAAIPQIAWPLSRSMQISTNEISRQLEQMQRYASSGRMMDPGVYLACFGLYPTVRKGFDVLVQKDAPDLLPSIALPYDRLTPGQLDIISQLDDRTMSACLRWLKARANSMEQQQAIFCQHVHNAILRLQDLVADVSFGQARFSSRRILLPCDGGAGKCTVFTFRIIMTLQSQCETLDLTLSPLQIFKAQQQVYTGASNHQSFARDLHVEFAHCVEREPAGDGRAPSVTSSLSWARTAPKSVSESIWRRQRHVESKNTSIAEKSLVKNPGFGGILVCNQVTVDVEHENDGSQRSIEMNDLGVSTEAGYGGRHDDTFVDELIAMCQLPGEGPIAI